MKAGNAQAKTVMESWANAEWFTSRGKVPEKITVTVFKVTGETNTDDLSPAPDAWSRPDIPLHALAMLKIPRDGLLPQERDELRPVVYGRRHPVRSEQAHGRRVHRQQDRPDLLQHHGGLRRLPD